MQKELLRAKGSIEALTTLMGSDGLSISTLADEMDVADSTARDRMDQFHREGYVTAEADLIDGQPKKVYRLSDRGLAVSDSLHEVLNEEGHEPSHETETMDERLDSDEEEAETDGGFDRPAGEAEHVTGE